MKKALSLILALILCLSLCACGTPKTREEAVKKAVTTMEKWDSKTKDIANYETQYFTDFGLVVKVTALTTGDMTAAGLAATAMTLAENVYDELSPILQPFDIDLSVTIYPEYGTSPIYVEINGKPSM